MKSNRIIKWFVRGVNIDGSRFESPIRHGTQASADLERSRWLPLAEVASAKIMRESSLPK